MKVNVTGVDTTFSTVIISTDQHESEAREVYDNLIKEFEKILDNFVRQQTMLTAERLSAKMIGG